jgi:polyribonucleotide nucleotidyltransferase
LEGLVKEGDPMKVKLIGTDPKSGKFKLSRKALLPMPERNASEAGDANE